DRGRPARGARLDYHALDPIKGWRRRQRRLSPRTGRLAAQSAFCYANSMSKRDETLQKAFSLHRSGDFAEAAKLYRKVIRQDPREANALHSLGIIEAASGNHAEAAALMARSVALQPANIEFMQNYATVLCQLGQFETASAVCLKGLALDGRN